MYDRQASQGLRAGRRASGTSARSSPFFSGFLIRKLSRSSPSLDACTRLLLEPVEPRRELCSARNLDGAARALDLLKLLRPRLFASNSVPLRQFDLGASLDRHWLADEKKGPAHERRWTSSSSSSRFPPSSLVSPPPLSQRHSLWSLLHSDREGRKRKRLTCARVYEPSAGSTACAVRAIHRGRRGST